uniref:Uncharacterized protein n=1 Tax=Panagrolaimus superbus TaxID=310955 RepID=A0A914Z6L7_9BILA
MPFTCQNDYISTKCVGDGEWIGGIKVTNNNLNFKCCKSETLKSAKFLSTFDIEKGQLFKGGNVIDIKNNIIAFDYISNIVKVINDGQKSYQAPILEIDNYAGAVSSDAIDGYEGVETTTTMSASDNVDSGYEGDGATTVESVYAPEETIDSYAAPLDSGYSDPATTTTTSSSYGDGYEVDTDSGYATTFEDDFDYNNTDIETDACFINGIPDPPDPADLEDDSARAKNLLIHKFQIHRFQILL